MRLSLFGRGRNCAAARGSIQEDLWEYVYADFSGNVGYIPVGFALGLGLSWHSYKQNWESVATRQKSLLGEKINLGGVELLAGVILYIKK